MIAAVTSAKKVTVTMHRDEQDLRVGGKITPAGLPAADAVVVISDEGEETETSVTSGDVSEETRENLVAGIVSLLEESRRTLGRYGLRIGSTGKAGMMGSKGFGGLWTWTVTAIEQ